MQQFLAHSFTNCTRGSIIREVLKWGGARGQMFCNKNKCISTKAQSMFESVVLDGVQGPTILTADTPYSVLVSL